MVTDVRLINKNGKDENYYSYDTLAWYHEDSLEVLDERRGIVMSDKRQKKDRYGKA